MTNYEEELKMQDEFLDESDNDALSISDLNEGSSFISNPKVGDAVKFTVDKISKLEGAKCVVKKKDGGSFNKSLSSVDYCYEITTSENATYTVSSWEIFGKIKAIFKKIGKIKGVELEVDHVKDGMKNREGDNYAVRTKIEGEYKSLNRDTGAWE